MYIVILGTSNIIHIRESVVMYTSCHGATIVTTNCTIVHKNVALHATIVSDVTIAQTDVTKAAS